MKKTNKKRKIIVEIGDADNKYCNACPFLDKGAYHAQCYALSGLSSDYWNLGKYYSGDRIRRHKKCIAAEKEGKK